MVVQPSDAPLEVALALSALPTEIAREVEPRWAERVAVCSNASTYRMVPDVPLIIPEVHPDPVSRHADLRRVARGARRNRAGDIVRGGPRESAADDGPGGGDERPDLAGVLPARGGLDQQERRNLNRRQRRRRHAAVPAGNGQSGRTA